MLDLKSGPVTILGMAGKTLRPRWWILTLTTAFAAGWALAPAERSAEIAAPPPPARKTKSSAQRERLDRSNPSARLVWNLLEEMDAAASPGSVTPAADRAAAARGAIDAWIGDGRNPQLLTEARIRFAHWLESDPKAAVMYWNGSEDKQPVEDLAGAAREQLLAMAPDDLIDWFAENKELANGAATDTLLEVVADACSERKDLALFERASAAMSPGLADRLLAKTISNWPANDLKPIEEFVRRSPNPVVVRKFVFRIATEERVAWLRNEIIGNGNLAEIVKSDGIAISSMGGACGASISERMALLTEIAESDGQGRYSNYTASALVSIDVSRWLSKTDAEAGPLTDWRHRLRMGEISAREVMEEARRALPVVAAEQAGEFREWMFSELVSINPVSAMEVISDLPLQQREGSMIRAAMSVAGQADPQHLLELVSTMPPTMATPANARFQMWVRAAKPCYDKYGESYVSWVTGMSPGIERDWALSGLIGHFQAGDPEKSATLAALKTLPAGWHPDK